MTSEVLASTALVSSQEVVKGVSWDIFIDCGKSTVHVLLLGVLSSGDYPNNFTLVARVARVYNCIVCVVRVNYAVVCYGLLRAEIQVALRAIAREIS